MATKLADPTDWIGTTEIMADYGVGRTTAWRLLREPDAPTLVIGKTRRARRGEFDQWLRARSDRIVAAAS